MITHLCVACSSPVEVDRVEVSVISDSSPVYMWGKWDMCAHCGRNALPMQVLDATTLRPIVGQEDGR